MRSITTLTLSVVAAVTLLAAPVRAQTAPPATTAPTTTTAPTAQAPATGGLTARPITPPTHHRMSLPARFAAANTTHDGHLTLAQAQAANMSNVVRNYDQIDTAKKGYVTIDDIHAFNRNRHRVRPSKATPKLEAQ